VNTYIIMGKHIFVPPDLFLRNKIIFVPKLVSRDWAYIGKSSFGLM
jgi:hypothetical protein